MGKTIGTVTIGQAPRTDVVPEIAEILGCSSKKMSLMLAEQGIYPLRGEGPTPCRMLIYTRDSEVQRFLVQVTGSDPREFRLVGFLGSAANIQ